MPEYIEKAEKMTLPVIVLHGILAFPMITLNFDVTEDENRAAVVAANLEDRCVFLTTSKIPGSEVKIDKLNEVGTAAKIKQSHADDDGSIHVVVEGFSRATMVKAFDAGKNGFIRAEVVCKAVNQLDEVGGPRGEALMREAVVAFDRMIKLFPTKTDELQKAVKTIDAPGLLADFIASNVLMRVEDKQRVLECFEPLDRLETLVRLLNEESEMFEIEFDIHKKVSERISDSQRERWLREQLTVIENELGEDDEDDEYYARIVSAKLPKEVEEKLLRESFRMSRSQFGSAEASVIRNYLDVCLELPWNEASRDRIDLAAASKILEADHDGLEKVKERILEYLAVKQLNPDLKNQIICLVGPPGTGKTSVAQSIARAMHRKYVRVSLGGVRDEADIRGHRKTYVGSMPGRIINALIQVKVKNPLMLLDEIDKVGSDGRGDPASALLELLDPEQNKLFRDHFVELPFDLSDCLFICTANSLETVPRPLIDRMEIIELTSYTRREKLSIAKNHLIPKQVKRHGLNGRIIRFTDDAVNEIIDYYTRESGVRNLEREIAAICRKAAKRIIENEVKRITVTPAEVNKMLGTRRVVPDKISDTDEVGVVNGLAYTEVGGDLLQVEVAVLDGTGKLELTGHLGDVMKESAKAAVSYIRKRAKELAIDPDFYKNKDIHIHVPEGAVPKDGPSAGVTIVTALVSALTDRAVHHDIAMTGEVTLRGRVLAIGGLREKTMAAYTNGVKRVIIPADNIGNLDDIDPEARANLEFIPVKTADEVLKVALCPPQKTLTVSAPLIPHEMPDILPDATQPTLKGELHGA